MKTKYENFLNENNSGLKVYKVRALAFGYNYYIVAAMNVEDSIQLVVDYDETNEVDESDVTEVHELNTTVTESGIIVDYDEI